MKLTERQRRFADEYIISGNATQAAIKAGYSEKTAAITGYENLRKPNISEYIDERLDAIKSDKVAQQKEVLEFLTAVMRGEQTDEELIPLLKGRDGQVIEKVDKRADTTIRVKSAELLGKRYGLWTDKVKTDKTVAETRYIEERIKVISSDNKGNEHKLIQFFDNINNELDKLNDNDGGIENGEL
ncbi:terminase small subunit [Macrococcoides goetzii]|uniref:terminase small subunit n=1 Tax=Macrococcus sp. PK TaxID=2801919 RepID=UPI001F10A1B4|nr:terminase small subunit [Macrococcus sp. PK]MCH4984920.1 terminase small subunit [Macrococcus sp. PK]